jgi:predicted lipoprotein with Yx(FWY)xxD motif
MSADRILSSPAGRVARVAVPLATVALALAACGSGSSAKTTPAAAVGTPSSSAGAGGGLTLSTKSGPVGTYLTDGSGRSLYEFASDTATKSLCLGACVSAWPPLTSSSAAIPGNGVIESDIGSITRSDGSKQVTYNGHPLYYFSGDSSAGQTNGQRSTAFGAKWWLLSPAGAVIKASSNSSGAYSY